MTCRPWSAPVFSSRPIRVGGKSWLLRLIAERAGIQTVVLGDEGEFASLREAVDMLLVGTSSELPANPRHAALLARTGSSNSRSQRQSISTAEARR